MTYAHEIHDPDGVAPQPGHPRRSNLPLDDLAWTRARADYVAGCSAAVVAERYGLHERTVRRRAAAEGWRADRPPARPERDPFFPSLSRMAGEPPTDSEAFAAHPDLEPFVAAHSHEIGQLLLCPGPERLSRFAFRRATEAAARGAPSEAVTWMRLVQTLARTQDHLEQAARPFAAADYLRAEFAARLREHAGDGSADRDEYERHDGDPNLHPTPKSECPDAR